MQMLKGGRKSDNINHTDTQIILPLLHSELRLRNFLQHESFDPTCLIRSINLQLKPQCAINMLSAIIIKYSSKKKMIPSINRSLAEISEHPTQEEYMREKEQSLAKFPSQILAEMLYRNLYDNKTKMSHLHFFQIYYSSYIRNNY